MNKNFNNKNILLIDDDGDTHLEMREMFKQTNSNLLSAQSGEEGLEVYKNEEVDLVLLDMNMPGMCGCETLEELKKLDYHADVIMCSTNTDLKERAYKMGAAAYLPKPINLNSLLHIIDVLFKLPKMG